MESRIRLMEERDRQQLLDMMRIFYASDAVSSNGSDEIFNADIDHCLQADPYVEGYVFEDDGHIQGYAMIAKSFSTEFGKHCIWIEDLYVKEAYRDLHIGSRFLSFIEATYPNALFRLEVEPENERAVHVYRKRGYDVLPYMEMKKQ